MSSDTTIILVCVVVLYMSIVGTNNYNLSNCVYPQRFRIYQYGDIIRVDKKIWWMLIIPYWKTDIGIKYSGIGENTESEWCGLYFSTIDEALNYIKFEVGIQPKETLPVEYYKYKIIT